MLGSVILVAVGLAVLVIASDRVVVSAVRISLRMGVSAILVGALIVGLGTSIPELLVSSIAAGDGRLDVAVGNVVGSNAANVTLVLGAAAVLTPIAASSLLMQRETPLMLVAVGFLALVIADQSVSRIEAGGLIVGLVAALTMLVYWSQRDPPDIDEDEAVVSPIALEFLYGVLAITATVIGAKLLLDGALDIGERLDWPATFLGLMLGVGTSLPELATAVAAARHREPELVLGNVIGSNIFNSLAVAGAAGLIGPGLLADFDAVAVWGMLGAVSLAAFTMLTGRIVSRFEGAALLTGFAALVVTNL